MFKTIKVESNLELPYNLIDIQDGEKRFIFSFKCFDDNQTEYSIQAGGVTGKFEVTYKCCGIDSNFECDITIGNLYYFYIELENVYECLPGIEPVAVLKNYGETLNRTNMTFTFDKLGHCNVNGCFKNASDGYNSGIIFELQIDMSYIYDMNLFRQLLKQGVIDKEEYNKVDTKMIEKYQPVFGTLFSEIPLT